jgi:hypothetical protein
MNLDSQNNSKSLSREISIKELILKVRSWVKYLFAKWPAILLFAVLGGGCGLIYAYIKKPVFTATTTFVLDDNSGSGGGLGQYAGLASMAGIDLGGGGGGIFQGDNILELYKSRSMIQKTLLTEVDCNGKKQLLIDRFIEFNELKKKWAKDPKLKEIEFSVARNSNLNNPISNRLKDSILGTIVTDIVTDYLSVTKPDKKLSIIKADVKSPDEFFAKNFNDKIVENVNDFYLQTKTKKLLENVSILQKKTDSIRNVMRGAIYTAVEVSDATPNLNPTRQIKRVAPVQQSQFTAETNKVVLGELTKNLEMSKITLHKETPLIQVVDSPILPLKKERLSVLKGAVVGSGLSVFFGVIFMSIGLIYKKILSGE